MENREMAADLKVKIYGRAHLDQYTTVREKETKIGQLIQVLDSSQASDFSKNLAAAARRGTKYSILLIPEDIGPRANYGRPGAEEAPRAFLTFFLNAQANRFLDCSKILLIGEADVGDLVEKSKKTEDVNALRELCAKLDERIAPIIKEITLAGLEPIVIGGGNNNSFPTVQGVAEAVRSKESKSDAGLCVINCDPHADFRPLEGRHSGNPFSYAQEEGYLKGYCVFGLHESYNSEEMLSRFDEHKFVMLKYEDFAVRKTITFESALEKAHEYLMANKLPIGCELDLDGIQNMPSSAKTPFGISEDQAAQFIHSIASRFNTSYLHLSEAAPRWSADDGARQVGKCLALLVVTYVKARELMGR